MSLSKFDEFRTYTVIENPFLFHGFPRKINHITIAPVKNCGCLMIEMGSPQSGLHHFLVKEEFLQGKQEPIHSAITHIRDQMFHILSADPTKHIYPVE